VAEDHLLPKVPQVAQRRRPRIVVVVDHVIRPYDIDIVMKAAGTSWEK